MRGGSASLSGLPYWSFKAKSEKFGFYQRSFIKGLPSLKCGLLAFFYQTKSYS